MDLWMKLFHVATAFWFVAGLLGRNIVLRHAASLSDVNTIASLARLAGRFERLMVIPGSFAVLAFGLITAWLQRWPIFSTESSVPSFWLVLSTILYLSLIPVVPLVFLPRGRVFDQALDEAVELGAVTPALRAAFADRAVAAARLYEMISVAVIIVLMVTKPF